VVSELPLLPNVSRSPASASNPIDARKGNTMGVVLSMAAIAILLVLIAVSLVRQRKLKAEQVATHDRERAAPGLAAQERFRLRRERAAAAEPPGR
jgi:hypothetical protein